MKTPIVAFLVLLLVVNTQAQDTDFMDCLDKILEIKNLFWHLIDELTTRDPAKIEAAWQSLVNGVKAALSECNPFKDSEHKCTDALEFLGILIKKDHLYTLLTDYMENDSEKIGDFARFFEEKLETCLAN